MTVTALRAARVDPLAPAAPECFRADGVIVRRRPHHAGRICAHRSGGSLVVEHNLSADELCDDLAVLLTEQLGAMLETQADFESVFTGVVRTTVPGPLAAWVRFYRNSVFRLETGRAAFAPVHQRAAELVTGRRLLDLGSCFGFFPLRMRRAGYQVTATDLSGPTMDLLDRVSTVLDRSVQTLVCDASRVPLPDGAADTVSVLHLLEHLDPDTGDGVLREAVRLARRRVTIAVPFEDEPQTCYGHIRRFDVDTLRRLAAEHSTMRTNVFEHHGGWLVLDRD